MAEDKNIDVMDADEAKRLNDEKKRVNEEITKLRIKDEATASYKKQLAEADAVKNVHVKDSHTGGTYEVNAVDISSSKERRKHLAEVKRVQDSLLLDYKDAISDVHYSIGSDLPENEYKAQLNNRLRAHNDSYYASMFTSVFSILDQEGITVRSLLEVKGNMVALEAFDPNSDMDKARFFQNLSQNLRATQDNHGALSRFLIKSVNKYLDAESIQSTSKGINTAVKNDKLDSLVMTPSMIAALKVNFDEQYYYDTRSISPSDKDYSEKMQKFTDAHNKAVEHVVAIAQNSGYDMSAIAEEERYIVGLKMLEDDQSPYKVIYNQTASMYGVRPVDTQGSKHPSDSSSYSGGFQSADGHTYTTGGSSKGSFEVAPRLNSNDGSLQNYKKELERNGQQFAWMMAYTDSEACFLDDNQKDDAKHRLVDIRDTVHKDAISRMKFDLNISEAEAEKLWESSFEKGYEDNINTNMESVFSEIENPFSDSSKSSKGMDFCRELRYTAEKEIFRSKLNIELPAAVKDSNGQYTDLTVRNDVLTELKNGSKDAAEKSGTIDNRTIDKFAIDMTDHWIESMDTEEYVDFLMHVGANMEQSYTNRGSYSRHDEKSFEEYSISQLESGREMPDSPSVPEEDDEAQGPDYNV